MKMETNKDFKCSKCGYETGSLVSLEWHVTSECPNIEHKKQNKFINDTKKFGKNLFISLLFMFVITYVLIGWVTLVYGYDVISFKQTLVFYIGCSLILSIILD